MKFNVNLYKLSILLNYGFLKVKSNKHGFLEVNPNSNYSNLWSTITNYEHFEYLSELEEVYALEIKGGRRCQVYFIYTCKEDDGSVVFVVDSSEPDGTGSYAVLPSILLKMYDDRVIVF